MNETEQKAKPISVEALLTDTYLSSIKNSVESNLFRNMYARVDGEKRDITENGNLSCSYFVSSILVINKLIKEIHATVSGTIRDLRESGWIETSEPQVGCVLMWEESDFGETGIHRHLGFYIGEGRAISNNSEKGYPTEHEWNNFNGREVELILWNPKLED